MWQQAEFLSKAQKVTLRQAVDLATQAHHGQNRDDGQPYISHPLQVAKTLCDWRMDIDTIVAGVLHDVVEDTATTLSKIENQFGKTVAFLVDGVTKVGLARSGMADLDSYLPKTKDNLTKLLIATGQDVRVLIIKLADRLHNLSTLSAKSPEKQHKVALESLEVFAPLADRLNMSLVKTEIEDLAYSYLEPKNYQVLKQKIETETGAADKKLSALKKEVERELKKAKIEFEISGRVKSVYSLYKKLKKNTFEEIYDLMALRIVVPTADDCYKVLGILHHIFIPLEQRLKDYIARPKLNGYRALHTTVRGYSDDNTEVIAEFQIRTTAMHEFAEHGLAASFHYNEQKLTKAYRKKQVEKLPENLYWIVELQNIARKMQTKKSDEDAQRELEKLKINLFADRIFVHSPKGDIYDMPADSLPLDFAYRVHSDLGHRAVGFKINGKMADFDTPLNDGDVVEVIISKNALPSWDRLNKIHTSHARGKLRAFLTKKVVRN